MPPPTALPHARLTITNAEAAEVCRAALGIRGIHDDALAHVLFGRGRCSWYLGDSHALPLGARDLLLHDANLVYTNLLVGTHEGSAQEAVHHLIRHLLASGLLSEKDL